MLRRPQMWPHQRIGVRKSPFQNGLVGLRRKGGVGIRPRGSLRCPTIVTLDANRRARVRVRHPEIGINPRRLKAMKRLSPECEETTGVRFEIEHVYGRPPDDRLPRSSLDPGLVSVRRLDWPGSHHDTKG